MSSEIFRSSDLHWVWAPIENRAGVALARRRVSLLASKLSFPGPDSIELVVTELATNVLRHAAAGQIVAMATPECLVVWAIDSGPGIPDRAKAMQDGYSTAGTLGTGLGTVDRLATEFLLSGAEGTIAVASFESDSQRTRFRSEASGSLPSADSGGLLRSRVVGPSAAAAASGDQWIVRRLSTGEEAVLVVDGLGHGKEAERAAVTAIDHFQTMTIDAPAPILRKLSERLRGTRGAVGFCAIIEPGRIRYCGVGNVVARLVGAESSTTMVNHNGVLGGPGRTLRDRELSIGDRMWCVLHTDGLSSRWEPKGLPRSQDARILAGHLLQNFGRRRDDSAVLVLRRWGQAA